ncbi:MAG: hypothetical protein KA444_04420, partial [Bacteroidia bacterium]|nr:hypothetical protein [Bacteroidia bacterium]
NSIQELLKEFPFFQSAQLLLARSMQDQEHIRFERQLKLASCYAADRSVLFSLVHNRQNVNENVATEDVLESDSPFQMEDPKPVIFPEKRIEPITKTTNPFIDLENATPEVFPVVSNETEVQATEVKEEIVYDYRYQEVDTEEEYIEQEAPVAQVKKDEPAEIVSSDPREILRHRLSEILTNPAAEGKANIQSQDATSANLNVSESPVETELKSDTGISQVMNSNLNEVHSNIDVNSSSQNEIVASDEIAESTDDVHNTVQTETAQNHPEATTEIEDPLGKMELEYALEESLLSSLEKLPVIEQQVEKIEEVSDPLTSEEKNPEPAFSVETGHLSFTNWLKHFGKADFGRFEEVHADDDQGQVSPEIPDQKIIDSPAKSERKTGSQDDNEPEARQKTAVFSNESDKSTGETGIPDQKRVLIDKFIATEPRIVPSKAEFYSPVVQAKKSVEEYDDVVSETLARIYRQQGHPLKARFCYEKLSLFYPEKRTYFAALVKEIDEELSNSNQEDL